MENNSRFNIKERSEIKDKYVIYVEDLYVSFFGQSSKKDIQKKIKSNKKLIKQLNKKNLHQNTNNLEAKNKELKEELSLKDKKERIKILSRLKTELENETNSKNKNKLKEKIKKIEKYNSDIENNNVKKNEKEILKGITFGLKQGETLAIVGANGAGKTVLIETILRINEPKSYKKMIVNLGHKTYTENLSEIGIQYQQSKIQSDFKVSEIIDIQKKLYGKKIDNVELQKMIEIFGIYEFVNWKVKGLSGGQKQRLNLLLAVMHQPKIMILDEFITGLDVANVRKIVTYINELKIKNKASMIIISHQPEEIEELSDRIIVMKEGKIIEETSPKEVIKKFNSMANFIEENI